MGNTTSTSKSLKITPQDKAVLQLKLQRDKLHKSSLKIQTVINREQEIAKKCLANNDRKRALLALRKKKYQQSLLDRVGQQADTLENLINTIEFKLIEKDFVYGIEQGNEVLKQLNSELSIEKVDRIMDESAEGVRYQEELSERLGEVMSQGLEDEVDRELAEMEAAERRRGETMDLPEAPKVPVLPEVPSEEVEERDERRESRERAEYERSESLIAS